VLASTPRIDCYQTINSVLYTHRFNIYRKKDRTFWWTEGAGFYTVACNI